jgi:competence protein ComEA
MIVRLLILAAAVAALPAAAQSSVESRLAVLENRVAHLESENERLTREVQALQARLAGGAAVVPAPGAPAAATPALPAGPNLPRVNVNTATAAELQTIRGIGPALAQRIIEGRPYQSVEDLDRVRGIGEVLMTELRQQARVD